MEDKFLSSHEHAKICQEGNAPYYDVAKKFAHHLAQRPFERVLFLDFWIHKRRLYHIFVVARRPIASMPTKHRQSQTPLVHDGGTAENHALNLLEKQSPAEDQRGRRACKNLGRTSRKPAGCRLNSESPTSG